MSAINSYQLSPEEVLDQYMLERGIPAQYKDPLMEMNKYNAVCLMDDSTSMEGYNWSLLQQLARKVVPFALLFDPKLSGYFMNMGKINDFASYDELATHLANPHGGLTPLFKTLDQILEDQAPSLSEKQIALHVFTDGRPSDKVNGITGYEGVAEWVNTKIKTNDVYKARIAIIFHMCTEDEEVLNGYNRVVDPIEGVRVDVMGTFKQEKKEFEKHNPGETYTEALDLVRRVTAGTNQALDDADQKKVHVREGVVTTNPGDIPSGCGCTIS